MGSQDSTMPDWKAHVRKRLPDLRISPARESDIVAELAQHLDEAYLDALAQGFSDADALKQAEARFADWRGLAHEIEETVPPALPERRSGPFAGIIDEIRLALRFVRKNPSFTAIAVATLALGIGGNTTIFTMADALALRGLPYPHSSQLMAIETH